MNRTNNKEDFPDISTIMSWEKFNTSQYFFNVLCCELKIIPPIDNSVTFHCQICNIFMIRLNNVTNLSKEKIVQCDLCEDMFASVFEDSTNKRDVAPPTL